MGRGALAVHFANLGTVSLNERQHIQALAFFDRAIALNPHEARHHYLKARTYEAAGNWQAALRGYEQVISMDAELGYHILMQWGQVAQRTGAHQQALEHLTRAIDLQPRLPETFRRRAESHYRLGEKTQCLADLRRALELSPADPQTYVALGWYYEQEGEMRLADAYYRYAEQLAGG